MEQLLFEKMFKVYLLKCPITGNVKYVGLTNQKLADRLNKHVSNSRNGNKSDISKWIRELLAVGLKPAIEAVICTSLLEEAKTLETFLITDLKTNTTFLLNKKTKSNWKPNSPMSEAGKRSMIDFHKNREYRRGFKLSKERKEYLLYMTCTPLIMMDMTGNEVKEFPSAKDAGIELGINASGIRNAARGRQPSAGGFLWKYKNPSDRKRMKSGIKKPRMSFNEFLETLNN